MKAHPLSLALPTMILMAAIATEPAKTPATSMSSNPHAHYAEINGLHLYYEIHGSGGTPLVLMHGGGSTIESNFGKIIEPLAKTRQVIAFEQQGHGHTSEGDRAYSFGQSAEDAAALLKHLGITRADFMGYSNGGHIAFEVALRHPEVVRKLIIESAMFDRSGTDPAFWSGFDHATLDHMPLELREAYLKVAPHPEDLPVFFKKSVERMKNFKGWTPEQMQSIQAPTLVLSGDRDLILPEHAVRLFRLLPHAQLAILPGADHMSILHQTEALLAIVPRFLDTP